MSIVDLILILLALLFAFSGFRQGLIVSAASFLGFFGGAVLGAQLSGPIAHRLGRARVRPGVLARGVSAARGPPGSAGPASAGCSSRSSSCSPVLCWARSSSAPSAGRCAGG